MKKKFFQGILIFISILISSNIVSSQEELRMSASEKAWSVFYPNDKKNCFIVSQSIKDEAFRNGEKLSSVNRDRGKLFVQKNPSSPAGFVASFSAGYPLKSFNPESRSIEDFSLSSIIVYYDNLNFLSKQNHLFLHHKC